MTPRPIIFPVFLNFLLPMSIGQVLDATRKEPSFLVNTPPFASIKP